MFILFVIQVANEQLQASSHQLSQFVCSFVSYKTPADEMTSTSDECGQQNYQRDSLSSVVTDRINGRGDVEDKADGDVLCSLFSKHSYAAARDRVGAVGEVIRVQQIELDDNKTQNTAEQQTHRNVKLYTCDVCSKSFTDVSNYKRHKLIHTGERHYKCDVCEKMFIHSHHLTVHKRTHL